ncbi:MULTISPECIES: nuclease-related domain-containing protein [Exiguobacterium]|uniref:nuclease-related domain-containing protein n=1 Tax=Exiguobacterium TaxID=33986 RepID=UPI000495E610|nr:MULTISPECIES: nuclease-related domain-containing protein [Exiguobacterium]TCI74012.1 NERD domain-containing protein [Exiguobacterium sp. IPCI3]TCI83169.1 NERD domain-containing protein [Exiguobacterium sp. IPCH1]TCI84223.1 NERD domain-containing protein [Exiguobacterium sp. IPBC4]
MLQVLTAVKKEPEKRQTKGLFRTKEEVIAPPKSYTDEIVEIIRHTCRFDWMMIEHVQLGEDVLDYVLVGPKGVFLVRINRTTSAVHMTNRDCRLETPLGWKNIYPHPIEELERMTKQVRSALKKECGQAIPVSSFLIFPEAERLKVERVKANCADTFDVVDAVITKTKLDLLSEATVKQVAYYCVERQIHK